MKRDFVLSNISKNQRLIGLCEISENISKINYRRGETRARVDEYIEIPYNQHEIVDRRQLVNRIIGSVAVGYSWQNGSNVHHVYWPARWYSRTNDPAHNVIAEEFREAPSLKYSLPEQMHDYLHFTTQPPKTQVLDVMEQYNREQRQVSQLHQVFVDYANLNIHEPNKRDYRKCWSRLLDLLDKMEDGHLGLMLSCEEIAAMKPENAFMYLRHRSCVPVIDSHGLQTGYREDIYYKKLMKR